MVPSVVPGDATTCHTLQTQRVLREAGYESEIFALAVHPALEHRVRLVHELTGMSLPGGHLLYQYSACSELADRLYARREPVAINYHNVTPPHFFHDWDRGTALAMRAARIQLEQLARRVAAGICDSAFNAEDLHALGVGQTTVVPVLVDLSEFDAEPDPTTVATLARRREAGRNGAGDGGAWLFVGALAPHKAQHELVQALAVTRAVYDPSARLSIVGRPVTPPYAEALGRYVHELGLDDAVDLAGGVSHEQLVAYYQDADVYVSLSRHEGFGVPLLEAMYHRLPIVARPAGAVASTVGEGALLLGRDSPHDVAAAVARVVTDARLRDSLLDGATRRVAHFAPERTRRAMGEAVRRFVEGSGVRPAGAPGAGGGAAA
jgi:glycosyltransferase involved in cell wall biosynthesis